MHNDRIGGTISSLAYTSRALVFAYALLTLPFVPAVLAGQTTKSSTAIDGTSDRIVKLPYAAQRRFTSIEKSRDGLPNTSESRGSEARDSEGRSFTAGERHWIYKENGKSILKSEMLYRVNDPIAQTTTSWDSSSKVAKVFKWPMGTAQSGAEQACQSACDAFLAFSSESGFKNVGTRIIEGLSAEGGRSTYSVETGKVVHEVWYSPELKIVILETNDDSRTGSWRNELITISRKEPEAAFFSPPKHYVIKEIALPVR